MRHHQIFELLPLYSLDALEGIERRQVERHLARCGLCQAELASYDRVAEALSGEMEPSPDTWQRIQERIDAR